jgi:hypothetical protein
MKRPCLIGLGLAGFVLAAVPLSLAHAGDDSDTFSVTPQQAVTFGGGAGDTFAVEQISRNDNTVTVLLRPKGESCTFRFDVIVGRSVQLRSDTPSGQSLLCKATLHPIIDDGSAQFDAECTEQPATTERKCPTEGSTASVSTYPQQ